MIVIIRECANCQVSIPVHCSVGLTDTTLTTVGGQLAQADHTCKYSGSIENAGAGNEGPN